MWTVGCADARLTAQARSPMDKPGKTPCVSPTLPTGQWLPTNFAALQQLQGFNLIPGVVKTFIRLPTLAYLPGNLSKGPAPPQLLPTEFKESSYLSDEVVQKYYEMHFGPYIAGDLASRLSFPQSTIAKDQRTTPPIESFANALLQNGVASEEQNQAP